mgnify:FL=1
MPTVIIFLLTLIVIVISVFITLVIKSELDKMFRDKKASIPFHICNVIATLILAYSLKFVMTVYVFKKEFHIIPQYFILLGIILPIYLFVNYLFKKHQWTYRKYSATEDGKIIILNEKYLQKRKTHSKYKNYNSKSKDH